ncbi:MAG TPA: hypothetical protein VHX14_06225 [Thermoanaerobaculia bacterium]|nr:hypothetical protein [Thermoanaerobaculia bacterium]
MDVRLTASAALVDIEIDVFAAVRAAERDQFSHQMIPRSRAYGIAVRITPATNTRIAFVKR